MKHLEKCSMDTWKLFATVKGLSWISVKSDLDGIGRHRGAGPPNTDNALPPWESLTRLREAHSTTTALGQVTSHITNKLNQQRPCRITVMPVLDLSKAFDTMHCAIFMEAILDLTLLNGLPGYNFELAEN